MTGVTLEEVRIERDGRVVLDVPRLAFGAGRTTAILGSNGAGKTTLLRVIAGLEWSGAGRVRFGGEPVRERRDLAYVFQEEVFLRESVRRNLELGLRVRGMASDERRQRVDDAAARVGVGHVSLARALCLRSPVVLLDEPLAGLDEHAYARLLDELPRIVDAFQATTILVTHSGEEALRLAADLVVLVEGRVLAAGAARDVAANPRVPAVADVLGYAVLTSRSRRLAVPPGSLRAGPGQPEFTMVVDRVLDMIGATEVVGRIGDRVVRMPWPGAEPLPREGERLVVHAIRFSELD